jgi:hypothetical protein
MKKIVYLLFISVLVFTLSSCNKDEDVYKTKHKIYKIWEISEVGDPDQTFTYNKDNLITSIDDYHEEDSTHYHFNFTYNKDNTVNNIEHSSSLYLESVQLYYMDKLVNRMTYSMNGQPRLELIFHRDPETTKITEIYEHYDVDFFTGFDKIASAPLFNSIIGLNDVVSAYYKNNTSKSLTLHCTRTIQFSGNNITKIHESYPEYSTEITQDLTYDTLSFNPFYGLPYTYKGLLGFSENNQISIYTLYFLNGVVTGDLSTSYQYYLDDEKFPRRIVTKKSPDFVPVSTYILYQLP